MVAALGRIAGALCLALILYVAVGAATEISARTFHYQKLSDYLDWLEKCDEAKGAICKGHDLANELPNVVKQKNDFTQLNNVGSFGNPCGIQRIVASPNQGMAEDCLLLQANKAAAEKDLNDPANKARLAAILKPDLLQINRIVRVEELSQETLYFLVAILAGGIGSLLMQLKKAAIPDLGSTLVGFGLGFISYPLMQAGSSIPGLSSYFTSSNVNPFTVAFIGFLFGAFSDQALQGLSYILDTLLKRNKQPETGGVPTPAPSPAPRPPARPGSPP
jgi:hypothetical protein